MSHEHKSPISIEALEEEISSLVKNLFETYKIQYKSTDEGIDNLNKFGQELYEKITTEISKIPEHDEEKKRELKQLQEKIKQEEEKLKDAFQQLESIKEYKERTQAAIDETPEEVKESYKILRDLPDQ